MQRIRYLKKWKIAKEVFRRASQGKSVKIENTGNPVTKIDVGTDQNSDAARTDHFEAFLNRCESISDIGDGIMLKINSDRPNKRTDTTLTEKRNCFLQRSHIEYLIGYNEIVKV